MTLDEMKFGFTVVNSLLTTVIGIYVWISNRNRVTNERISSMERNVDDRLDIYADRLARLEQKVESGPSHDDIKRLHQRIDNIDSGLARLDGQFSGTKHTVDLIYEYLLKGNK